jgi:hypothetical protein
MGHLRRQGRHPGQGPLCREVGAQAGLDHYQVRHRTSRHHHITLAMLAPVFLTALAAGADQDRPTPPQPHQYTRPTDRPGDPPPSRRRPHHSGHVHSQAAALVQLAQIPPGRSPTLSLPTAIRRRTRQTDHETALECWAGASTGPESLILSVAGMTARNCRAAGPSRGVRGRAAPVGGQAPGCSPSEPGVGSPLTSPK